MLTLYLSPGACSFAIHIMLCEKNLEFKIKKVNLHDHIVEDGSKLESINSKGYVPTLILDNGEVLTEIAAILSYIAPPSTDKFVCYRMQEWLAFISSELHKSFAPFFSRDSSEDFKSFFREKLRKRFDYVDNELATKNFLLGKDFSAADAYMFTILRWLKLVNTGLPFSNWGNIDNYYAELSKRPAIQLAAHEESIRL